MRPLAERMRPRTLDEMVGQRRLLAPGSALRRAIESGNVHSMILWGPPGCGKTTLALLLARYADAEFRSVSAVLSGLPEVRQVLAEAGAQFAQGRRTVLFVDEAHRFNKAQQDAFLPHIERGTIVFVGATTENPSFELNSALLSRLRVFVLKPLSDEDLATLVGRALADPERGLGGAPLPAAWIARIVEVADGDARRALILAETAVELVRAEGSADEAALEKLIGRGLRRFDKLGEVFYDQISALHKSVRGSDPDAALYWYARMLDGGADPRYLARRVTRMAVEDVGLADSKALGLCLDAWQTYERLGSPEGELAIAQAIVYLACVPKSNAVYAAYGAVREAVERHGSLEVPLHIRNAPTKLMKDLGYGREYRYDHDEADAHAAGQQFLPDKLRGTEFYKPTARGLEARIAEKLAELRRRNREGR